MNRKIILLNVVLVLVVAYGGTLLRRQILAVNSQHAKMLAEKPKAALPGPLAPLPVLPPVLATGYKDVAMKTLFHPSRNPDLPPPPPPPAPPPPPPMPALPKYHGSMSIFGTGQQALLSLGSVSVQPVSIGEMIGPFKLVDVNMVDITFDFEGTIVRRTLAQLMDRTVVAQSSGSGSGSGSADTRSSSPPPPPPPVIKQPMGPQGETTSFGFKACAPNESMPDGTVQGGFRKVTYQTPFGPACRWDPIAGR
jgi:hypothetical protein